MTRSTRAVLGAAALALAALAALAAGTAKSSVPRPRLLVKAALEPSGPRPRAAVAAADTASRSGAEPAPSEPAQAVWAPDPYYDAATCSGLEVPRASSTLAGGDAFVEIARDGQPSARLRLGDELDDRLLGFVGAHPASGRLTVVFEGPAGPCRAEPRTQGLLLQREDQRASLSAPLHPLDGSWSAAKGRAAEADAMGAFALAFGGSRPEASDVQKAPQGAERAR
jgi:hypothetical protein